MCECYVRETLASPPPDQGTLRGRASELGRYKPEQSPRFCPSGVGLCSGSSN